VLGDPYRGSAAKLAELLPYTRVTPSMRRPIPVKSVFTL